MARTAITPQQILPTGTEVTFEAANVDGNSVVNNGATNLHVVNGGGVSIDVTVTAQNKCNQGYLHDLVVAVPAGEERVIGPFTVAHYNDATGAIIVDYDSVTSVTVAAIK